ncbi:MAG: dihydrofolate reductase family protein, partial [Candidatus Eremiobacteraeota bacterium]|nr:dihydrofolate reductase family protein [Candidatus Eremiobacteraeota bacterium]
SRTLTDAAPHKARVERSFQPEAIRKLKRESERDALIGGAELAGLAFDAGLIDECRLFVHPLIVGGGKPAFRAGLRRNLQLLETHSFGGGVIYLRYRVQV